MNNIRIKKMTHRCRCQVPGCRNRDALKISKRDDVNGRPMFLCPECIKGIYVLYADMFGVADEETEITEITSEETEATEVTEEATEGKADKVDTNRAKSNSGGKRNSGAKK